MRFSLPIIKTTSAAFAAHSILILHKTACAAATEVQEEDICTDEFRYGLNHPCGPNKWYTIQFEDGTDNACNGLANSPINIQENKCTDVANYGLKDGTCTLDDLVFFSNNHAVEVMWPQDDSNCTLPTMEIPGKEGIFTLNQVHIHASSEHTINGVLSPAEMHMVHTRTDEGAGSPPDQAVIGLFLHVSSAYNDPIFESLLNRWDLAESPGYISEDNAENFNVNVYDLIPPDSTYYQYRGSLTTPPCTENLEWSVADKHIRLGVKQYGRLTELILKFVKFDVSACESLMKQSVYSQYTNMYCSNSSVASDSGSTSRPVQEINGRQIKRICPVGFDEDSTEESSSNGSSSILTPDFLKATIAIVVGIGQLMI